MPILRSLIALADENTRKSWFLKKKPKPKPVQPARKPKQAPEMPKEWKNYKMLENQHPVRLQMLKTSASFKPRLAFIDKKLFTPLIGSSFLKNEENSKAASYSKAHGLFLPPLVHKHKGRYYSLDDPKFGAGAIHSMNKKTVPVTEIRLSERAPHMSLIKMQHIKLTRNRK